MTFVNLDSNVPLQKQCPGRSEKKKINKKNKKIHKHTMLVNIVNVRYFFLPKAQSRGEAPQGIFCEMYLGELTRILQTPGCYFCSLKLSVTCLINFALTGCTQRISCSGTHRGKNKTKQNNTKQQPHCSFCSLLCN